MIAAVCLTLVVVLLLVVLCLQQRAHADAETRWTVERRELVSRIQAPERLPVETSEAWVLPEREPDEWAKVGTVEIDPKYGLDDE